MWNNHDMMEEKAGVEKQNSKRGLENNGHTCSVDGVLWVSDCTARQYLKVAILTRKIQSSSKLGQTAATVLKVCTPLGITGLARADEQHPCPRASQGERSTPSRSAVSPRGCGRQAAGIARPLTGKQVDLAS